MINRVPQKIEKCRVTTGPMRSDSSYGMNGFFLLIVRGQKLKVMVSDGNHGDWEKAGMTGEPWEHISVSLQHRCPSWTEMSYVKDLFWADWETVIQIHPPKDQYVNAHPYCLHLWKPVKTKIPLPPRITLAP